MMSFETDRLGDEIAVMAANIEAAEYRLIIKIGEFDARDGWVPEGALSCAEWLSWRIGLGLVQAREKVRVARALPGLPRISKAFEEARISYSKVRAITRVATPENEEMLVDLATEATAALLERICRKFRGVLEVERERETPEEADRRRAVRLDHLDDGRVRITATLPAEEGARFMAAIEAARDVEAREQAGAEERPAEDNASRASAEASVEGKRRPTLADGLMIVAESFLLTGAGRRSGGAPYEVRLHVTPEQLAEGAEGAFIENDGISGVSAEASRRIACDAAVVRVTEDDAGNVLDVGRRTRSIPPSIRRALEVRDRATCAFPGCRHTRFLEAHHIVHWALGGPTSLINLVLLCPRHHTFVHEHGYRVELDAFGRPIFVSPKKTLRPWTYVPPAPPVDEKHASGALEALAEESRSRGISIDALQLMPQHWWGENADMPWIIDVLCGQTFPQKRS